MKQRSIYLRLALLAPLALTCLTLGGCYQRVVKAHGYNAGSYEVYEPSESDTALDRAFDKIVGTDEKKRR